MPNTGNPNITEISKGTQFKAGDGRKRGGDKAWSIRSQVRYIAAQDIDIKKKDALEELFGKKPTVAQRIAFEAILQATKKNADIRAIEFTDDRIDGKLPQTTINADFEKIKKMPDDELRNFITAGIATLSAGGVGNPGSTEAGNTDSGTTPTSEAGTAASVPEAVDTPTT